MKFSTLIYIPLVLGLSACGSLQRHPDSGYTHWDDEDREIDGPSRTLTSLERRQIDDQLEIRRLQNGIRSEEEDEQYERYKSSMTHQERVEFLRLKDRNSRERWARARGLSAEGRKYERTIASAIEEGDLVLGMPKEAVKESWGDPEVVEVAGSPSSGNERWKYIREIASSDGYQTEERFIYFERGRVVGWERH